MAERGWSLNKKAVLRIFRRHSGNLFQGINSTDIPFLSWKLYSEEIITQSNAKSARNPYRDEGHQASALIEGVESKLHSSPDDILVFLSILDLCTGSSLPAVAEKIRQDLAIGKQMACISHSSIEHLSTIVFSVRIVVAKQNKPRAFPLFHEKDQVSRI